MHYFSIGSTDLECPKSDKACVLREEILYSTERDCY